MERKLAHSAARRLGPGAFTLLTGVLLAGCGGQPGGVPAPADPLAAVPRAWPLFDQVATAHGAQAMVSSVHPLATDVGVTLLRNGGNAIDAAVAMGFALAVVHPRAGNIGGGGFMLIRRADGTVQTLDFREVAPAAATADMYLSADGQVTDVAALGHLAVGVPGTVAGLAAAHARFGTLPFADVVGPAVRLAREGHVVDTARARIIRATAAALSRFPASRALFLPEGHAPLPGGRWTQPDLARTLQAISDSGPAVFYEGYVADLIVAEMRRGGGIITHQDLRAYHPIWRDPVVAHYRGHMVYSMPPSSSGGVTMTEILNILEGFAPLPAFGTAEHAHVLAEAMRRGFIDRNELLGDPAFVDMPLRRLLSKRYAGELRRQILPDAATPTPRFAGVSGGNHTTHYSVVDEEGNAVSVTTTLNSDFGSKVTVTGAGFLLNNEMDDFTAAPGHPNQYGLIQGQNNAIAPGKRMLSAMTPTIVLDPAGELMMVLGTPGGPRIISSVLQVISNVLDHGMSLADAVAAPRVHHQALPDEIVYEPGGLLPGVISRLRAMGHTLTERREYSGEIMAIQRTRGGWVGVADPRAAGAARGY